MTAPKHMAEVPVRTHPRVQPAGRHVDSIVTRLGARVFDMDEFRTLLHDITVGNPFRHGAR